MSFQWITDMLTDLRKLYRPQPNITTFELAQLVPYLAMPAVVKGHAWRFSPRGWDEFPAELKRHFIDGDPPLWFDDTKERQDLLEWRQIQKHLDALRIGRKQ